MTVVRLFVAALLGRELRHFGRVRQRIGEMRFRARWRRSGRAVLWTVGSVFVPDLDIRLSWKQGGRNWQTTRRIRIKDGETEIFTIWDNQASNKPLIKQRFEIYYTIKVFLKIQRSKVSI